MSNLKKQLTTENKKKLINLCLNICAILIFNCVLQFLCYPAFEKELGKEINGIVLTLISVVAITAGSFGSAANYSRLVNENVHRPSNGDYNVILLIGGLICSGAGLIFLFTQSLFTPLHGIIFALLIFFTAIRYYADVEYKIKTNFLKYFFYYSFLSVGYVVGIFLFKASGIWSVAILLGEILAVCYALFSTKTFRTDLKISPKFKLVLKSISLLLMSCLLEALTLNADRLVLYYIVDGSDVTRYYVASLFGKVIALLTVPVNSIIISYLIRFNGKLTKKFWSVLVGLSLTVGAISLAFCYVGSVIILPVLYDWFIEVLPILFPAILSQVLFFISSVLLVVLLRFYGEKKQFLLNLIYATIFFAACIAATAVYGLAGFVFASLIVNAIRLAIIVLLGFISTKERKARLQDG